MADTLLVEYQQQIISTQKIFAVFSDLVIGQLGMTSKILK